MSLRLVPVRWGDSCGFVEMWHRHHKPPTGHKFCIGVADDLDVLVGVAIVGRPTPRAFQDGMTLEVNRTATDGSNCPMPSAPVPPPTPTGLLRVVVTVGERGRGTTLTIADCPVCGDRCSAPDTSRDAHRMWAQRHANRTGHTTLVETTRIRSYKPPANPYATETRESAGSETDHG